MTEKDGGKGFESAGGKLNISGSCQKQEWKLPRWPGRSSCSEKKEEKAGEIIIKRSHRTAAQSFSIRFDLVEHLLSFQCQMKLWLWGFYWVPWECCLFFSLLSFLLRTFLWAYNKVWIELLLWFFVPWPQREGDAWRLRKAAGWSCVVFMSARRSYNTLEHGEIQTERIQKSTVSGFCLLLWSILWHLI